MQKSTVLISKYYELGPLLRRGFWQPLRRMMQIFHVLPLTAALITFFLLATNGQLREIYLSYLEDLSDPGQITSTAAGCAAAAVGLGLLSALLYVAHYGLSTMRINIVYSSSSNPDAGSRMRTLQRGAAVSLALFPWLGLIAGLFGARKYLIQTYALLKGAGIDGSELAAILHLPAPSGWVIPVSTILQGLATALFVDLFRQNRGVQWASIFINPLAAAVLFLLLTNSSPGAGSKIPTPVLLGVALIVAGYCLVHILLYRMRTKFIFSHALHPDTGINLRQRRRIFLFVWALFPWLAIAFYFAIPLHFEKDIAPGLPSWVMIPLAMTWTIAMGLSVAMLLDRFRENAALSWTIIVSIALLLIAAEAASWLGTGAIVSLYRWVGPIGSIALELLFVLSTLTLLAWLSQKSGFPALTLVALAMVISTIFPIPIQMTVFVLTIVCVLFAVIALLSRHIAVAAIAMLLVLPGADNLLEEASTASVTPITSKPDPDLCQQFETWLDQPERAPKTGAAADYCAHDGTLAVGPPDESASQGRYPVFIIAVEGGGIYAAAAASVFLARLQDRDPDFSQHVFAISGVSGGAIGATIFQALDRSALKGSTTVVASPKPDACPKSPAAANQPATRPPLELEVSQIMQDDHLSPVVASIFPAFFGAPTQRAETLAESFEDSVCSQDADAAQELEGAFLNHWSADSLVPALVLNTTWVETGFRVVFAPFPLHDSGDQSLYSFSDMYMPGEDMYMPSEGHHVSLMDAAVNSARFPGMLPPFSVTMKENTDAHLLWSFVDGGYSDNSGASTALALYRALEPIAQKRDVDIKIILLTSSSPQPDLSPANVQISGSALHETLAPIDAIMKVREGLGNEAVARVCDFFDPSGTCNRQSAAPGVPLQIVEIDDQTYGLSLGLKLSRMSFDIVSWMLGNPDLCDDATIAQLRRNNSCVLKHVEDLLDGKQSNSQ